MVVISKEEQKMKNYGIKTSLLAICTASLIGCGGGSSSESKEVVQETSSPIDYYLPYLKLINDDEDKVMIGAQTLIVKNNLLYQNSTIKEDAEEWFSNINPYSYLTPEGLYRTETKYSALGIPFGRVDKIDSKQVTYFPYNLDGYKDYEIKVDYEWRDIEGAEMKEFIYLADVKDQQSRSARIVKALESTKFPAGSQCYANLKVSKNINHIAVSNVLDITQNNKKLETLAEVKQYYGLNENNSVDTQWAGITWTKRQDSDTVYLEYDHKVHQGKYYQKSEEINNGDCLTINKKAYEAIEKLVNETK